MVSVRYIVDDVDEAIRFYTERLGFEVAMHPAPGFAALDRGDLRLMLNAPRGPGGAAQPALDGRTPEPGGWNRIRIEVDDLDRAVEDLRAAGVPLRTGVVTGRGARQALVDDPAGNCVELFDNPRESATTS
jgi:catechol 2,3-dioxygenase-like lactoylglutathione lyase family enzyme